MKLSTLLFSSFIGLSTLVGGVAEARSMSMEWDAQQGKVYSTGIDLCEAESTSLFKTWSYDCSVKAIPVDGATVLEVSPSNNNVGIQSVTIYPNGKATVFFDDMNVQGVWKQVNRKDKNWVYVDMGNGQRFWMIDNYNR